MPTVSVQENLMWVRDRIRALAGAANRGPEAVRLIAVSKTVSIDVAHEAYAAGQRAFGENRVLELEEKAPRLPADCEWHMIGHLQKNKVRSIVRHAAWIHSVDSVALLQRIDGIAAEEGRCPRVLVQVNISGEATKSGVTPGEARPIVAEARNCRNLVCAGLMTMAPFDSEPADLHRFFGSLRLLRDELESACGCALPELSMGMSGDYEIAVAEGATMVRIGTAIFGAREGV